MGQAGGARAAWGEEKMLEEYMKDQRQMISEQGANFEDGMPDPDLDPKILREMLRVERKTHAQVYDLARRLAAQLLILANDFHESKDLEELAYNIGGHIESADAALAEARRAGVVK